MRSPQFVASFKGGKARLSASALHLRKVAGAMSIACASGAGNQSAPARRSLQTLSA